MTLTTITRTVGARRRAGAGLLLAGAIALAGCGSNGDDAASPAASGSTAAAAQQPFEAVNAASTMSAQAGTANFTIDSTSTVGGQTGTVTGKGQLDSTEQAMSLDLTTAAPGSPSSTISEVVIGGDAYLKGIPGYPADQWLTTSLDDLGVSGSSSSDPSAQLGLLSDVAGDVTAAGTEDVNGVEATKYTGSIDLAKVADAAESEGADSATLKKQYQALGLTSVPFEVYIDSKGLPVRMVTTFSANVQGQALDSSSTVDFSDWGSDVSITAPTGAVPFDPKAMQAAPAA